MTPLTRSCTLYRAFAEDDTLLYVGATVNVGARVNQHREKPWWLEASRIELEHFDSVEAANQAEKVAIETESPRENRVVPQRILTDDDLVERRRRREERDAEWARQSEKRERERKELAAASYSARVMCCCNCGRSGDFWFPKGVAIADHPCSVCGTADWAVQKGKAA